MSWVQVGRLGIVTFAASLMGLAGLTAAKAYDRNDLDTFLETNSCPRCDLSGADLSYLDLRNADLRNANLRSADLSYSDLSFADLRGADLRGAITVGTLFQQVRR